MSGVFPGPVGWVLRCNVGKNHRIEAIYPHSDAYELKNQDLELLPCVGCKLKLRMNDTAARNIHVIDIYEGEATRYLFVFWTCSYESSKRAARPSSRSQPPLLGFCSRCPLATGDAHTPNFACV
jgi:hypothetical protein